MLKATEDSLYPNGLIFTFFFFFPFKQWPDRAQQISIMRWRKCYSPDLTVEGKPGSGAADALGNSWRQGLGCPFLGQGPGRIPPPPAPGSIRVGSGWSQGGLRARLSLEPGILHVWEARKPWWHLRYGRFLHNTWVSSQQHSCKCKHRNVHTDTRVQVPFPPKQEGTEPTALFGHWGTIVCICFLNE